VSTLFPTTTEPPLNHHDNTQAMKMDLSGIAGGSNKLKRTTVQESTGAAQKEDLSKMGELST
jgi:hypothetical protein